MDDSTVQWSHDRYKECTTKLSQFLKGVCSVVCLCGLSISSIPNISVAPALMMAITNL